MHLLLVHGSILLYDIKLDQPVIALSMRSLHAAPKLQQIHTAFKSTTSFMIIPRIFGLVQSDNRLPRLAPDCLGRFYNPQYFPSLPDVPKLAAQDDQRWTQLEEMHTV
jgi:hypothetical protein